MKKKSVPSTSRVSTSNSKDYQENVSRIKPKMEEIDFKDKK